METVQHRDVVVEIKAMDSTRWEVRYDETFVRYAAGRRSESIRRLVTKRIFEVRASLSRTEFDTIGP